MVFGTIIAVSTRSVRMPMQLLVYYTWLVGNGVPLPSIDDFALYGAASLILAAYTAFLLILAVKWDD